MGIDSIKSKKVNPIQGIQQTQGGQSQKVKGSTQGSGAGSSLVDKLNGMDNKLNQGGGVSLSNSSATQTGGQDGVHKKHKL